MPDNAAIQLALVSDRHPEQVAELTRDLTQDLHDAGEFDVAQVGRPPKAGERSAEIGILGQLGLTFLSAGAATALINCLKSYIERDRDLKFRLKRPDGTELELESANLQSDSLQGTLASLERFIE